MLFSPQWRNQQLFFSPIKQLPNHWLQRSHCEGPGSAGGTPHLYPPWTQGDAAAARSLTKSVKLCCRPETKFIGSCSHVLCVEVWLVPSVGEWVWGNEAVNVKMDRFTIMVTFILKLLLFRVLWLRWPFLRLEISLHLEEETVRWALCNFVVFKSQLLLL